MSPFRNALQENLSSVMVFHNQQLQCLFQQEVISSRWFWETGDMHRPRALLRCTQGAAGAKKAAWTGANWKRIDFPPKFQLDLSSAHVYSTNPSFPPLALIGLQSFLLPLLLALTAFLNEPQKFSSISCKGKFSLGNDQVWPEISSADVIFRSAFSEIFSCIYKSKWFAFLLL